MAISDIQNDKLMMSQCDLGVGIFAKTALRPREVCSFLTGETIRFEETKDVQGENAIQIGPGLYVDPGFPLRFINHSCEPNVGLSDDIVLIAIKPIKAGEELRFDYSTTMYERYFTMLCDCKAPSCRGVIEDFDLLPDEIREKYLDLNIVQTFIRDRIPGEQPRISHNPRLLQSIEEECSLKQGTDRVLASITEPELITGT